MTLNELCERYLEHSSQNQIHTTQARNERVTTFKQLCDWQPTADRPLGQYDVADLMPFHLEDFVAAHPIWRSSSTRKAKVNQINAAFNWALKGKRITDNPFSQITYPEAPPRPCLPDQMLDQVCAVSNKRYERFLRFLRLTGRRLSEAAALRWSHIDWENAVAVLPPKMHKSGKKTGRTLTIPFVSEAMELLRVIQETDQHDEYVFVNNRGGPWTRGSLGQQLRRLKAAQGITTKASLHGIRHQVGTEAVRGGVHLKYVSQALGHSSQAITERFYVHVSEDVQQMRAALESSLKKKE